MYWAWPRPVEAWTQNLSVRVGASMDSIAPACFTNNQLDRDVGSCMPTRHRFTGVMGIIVLLRRSQLMWDSGEAGPKVLQIGKKLPLSQKKKLSARKLSRLLESCQTDGMCFSVTKC